MDKYESAVRHHRAGKLTEAERLYRETVVEQPNNDQAWFLLSVLAMGRGDNDAAYSQLTRAIALSPNSPSYHSNLGLLHRKLGHTDEAATALLRAVSLKPDSVEASHNLGLVMQDAGNLAAALVCFERVAELKPELAANQHQLARALASQGDLRRAVGHYHCALATDRKLEVAVLELTQLLGRLGRHSAAEHLLGPIVGIEGPRTLGAVSHSADDRLHQACDLRRRGQSQEARALLIELATNLPEWIDAIIELGSVLEEIGDLDAALLCFEQATDVDCQNAAAQYRLANVLIFRGEPEVAIGHLQCATILQPDNSEYIEGLATLYHGLERVPAEALYRRTLQIRPDWAKPYAELGTLLAAKGRHDEAMECLDRAIELEPELSAAWAGRALSFFEAGRVSDALQSNKQALMLTPTPEVQARHLYMMMYDPAARAEAICEEAKRFNQAHAAPLLPDAVGRNSRLMIPERRLRVGYVSADFRNHCQSFYVLPLLKHHDQERFDVTCYSTTRHPDSVTEQLIKCPVTWRDVRNLNDVALAQAIREDEIDILFDLTMHMHGGRPLVFARKPAPLQIAWLAYPGTTGLSAIDYRLSDPHIDPEGPLEAQYVERTVRLPDSFWCYDPLRDGPAVGPLPAFESGHVTFGCLNSFAKTNTQSFELWASAMHAVFNSRLMLLAPSGSTRERTLQEFERLGIVESRITFVNRQPRPKYLELYHGIDLCLDTVPYNGHTTSFDATWMGVPVITLVGDTAVGRAGACLAHNLQLPELVARTPAEYVERAVRLASDMVRLSELRATLRARMQSSPLMDAQRFARNFESTLRNLWREYCAR